jgi:DNA topoisomerase VI subunit B
VDTRNSTGSGSRLKRNGKIQKTAFDTPLSIDYFYADKLQKHVSRPIRDFPAVVLKELVDNALDACEDAGVAPEIEIHMAHSLGTLTLSVGDNGDGIPPDLVKRIIDYSTHTSDKALYRTPSRGQQGNAAKTVIAMPFALGDHDPLVIIRAQGVEHRIRARLDAGDRPKIDREPVPCENGKPGLEPTEWVGTQVNVRLPLHRFNTGWVYHRTRLQHLSRGYHLFNPHAKVTFRVSGYANNHGESDERAISKPKKLTFRPM